MSCILRSALLSIVIHAALEMIIFVHIEVFLINRSTCGVIVSEREVDRTLVIHSEIADNRATITASLSESFTLISGGQEHICIATPRTFRLLISIVESTPCIIVRIIGP